MGVNTTILCGDLGFSVFPAWHWPRWPSPGVYMLCRRDLRGSREILYIGETANLATRLGPAHEQWAEALTLGMNEVLVHLLAKTQAQRLAVETRLRHLYPTRLNRQGSPALLAEALLGGRRPGVARSFSQLRARQD